MCRSPAVRPHVGHPDSPRCWAACTGCSVCTRSLGELFNALVGAITVVLLMLIAERVFDRRTAIVAGAMLAVLPGPILWTDVLVSETLYTALFVARRAWCWSRPGRRGNGCSAFGFVVGIGALVRGEALTWVVLPVVMWWRIVPWRPLARVVLVAVATAVVVMLPWTVRNAVVMDAFVPVATNASETLWSGHNPDATGAQVYPSEEFDDQFDQDAAGARARAGEGTPQRCDRLHGHPSGARAGADPAQADPPQPRRLVRARLGQRARRRRGAAAVADPGRADRRARRPRLLRPVDVDCRSAASCSAGASGDRRIGRIAGTSFVTALVLYGFVYYGNYRYRLPYEPLMVLVAAALVTGAFRSRELLAGCGAETRANEPIATYDGRFRTGTVRVMRVDVLTAERPTWRGLFHAWAFWLAIPAGVLLILFADQPARTHVGGDLRRSRCSPCSARRRRTTGSPRAIGHARSCSVPTTR